VRYREHQLFTVSFLDQSPELHGSHTLKKKKAQYTYQHKIIIIIKKWVIYMMIYKNGSLYLQILIPHIRRRKRRK
jgi:hypothetical protein